MPTIKIELLEGRDNQTVFAIRDSVMNSAVDILQLPENDRNIRIIGYREGFFQMKPPYEILIEISLFAGRSKETKRKLFQSIVNDLSEKNLIAADKVLITLNEQPMENWGGRGGIPADEMELGFKVKI